MKKTKTLKGESMITLTEKETLLAQHLIDTTDDSEAHICSEDWIDIKSLGFDIKTLKGVFGSLVQKNLLEYSDTNENGDIYVWTYPVLENNIKDVNELLIQKERA